MFTQRTQGSSSVPLGHRETSNATFQRMPASTQHEASAVKPLQASAVSAMASYTAACQPVSRGSPAAARSRWCSQNSRDSCTACAHMGANRPQTSCWNASSVAHSAAGVICASGAPGSSSKCTASPNANRRCVSACAPGLDSAAEEHMWALKAMTCVVAATCSGTAHLHESRGAEGRAAG